MSDFSTILAVGFALLLGGFAGYEIGELKGWRRGVDESYHAFYEEGYYNGWVARHHRVILEDKRVHPDMMQRLMPSLTDPGQEIVNWMRQGDHLPFEEYRSEQVAKLNKQINQVQ